MASSSFPLLFLQASISAFLTCSVAWCILTLARRFRPGLAARRTPWLLAQLIGVTTLVVLSAPAASRLSLFSIEPQPHVAELATYLPAVDHQEFAASGVDDLSSDEQLPTLAWFWLALYIAGATWHTLRMHRPHRTLRTLLSLAARLDRQALQAHPGFAAHAGTALPVLEVDAPVSPLLAGLIHPVLLLPSHMRKLPAAQQQLIVAHELMHLRRHDHVWQHAGALLQVLLWFIPAVYSFKRSLQWAVELGCDRAVLADRPDSERRSYAAALLAQLAVQLRAGGAAQGTAAGLAFGFQGAQVVAERIRLIRDAQSLPRGGIAGMATVLFLPALCGASVLLQPQFAWSGSAEGSSPVAHIGAPDSVPAAGAAAWRAPLAQLQVTSSFGSTNGRGGKRHSGTDFRASRGTAVFSPANGRVSTSTDRYEGGARYGKVVVIEHDDGMRTLYAHLDGRTVRTGDIVRAGQQIAVSGASGKVSGPHLHFEVSRRGTHIDPQAVLEGAAPSPAHD